MSEKELLEEIKRHIDYTNAMGEKSLRDLQIENLYNLLQQKNNIIKEVRKLRKKISNLYYEEGFELDTPMLLKYIDEILDKGE